VLGIIIVDFDIMEQVLIMYSAFVRYYRKLKYNGTVHELFIDFKKTFESFGRGELYTILSELIYQ
jgi:hypothetical protein